jgi:hypothetical protein
MGKIEDLTGQTFGRLVVLERSENRISPNGKPKTRWLCLCSCGNKKIIDASSLKSSAIVSCGCYQKEMASKASLVDISGKRFGRLIVLERGEDYISPKNERQTQWICQCDCGNITTVIRGSLTSGNTLSCGCYNKEKDVPNLIGKRFGMLLVLSLGESNGRRGSYWLCQCDCGNIKSINGSTLTCGYTNNCGCLSESFIALGLKKYFSNKYIVEKEYQIFKNPKTGYWLPYDIYIPYGEDSRINGIYIEIHGEQHYRICNWHFRLAEKNETTPQEEFEYQKYKDKEKKKFAKKYGTYIEVNLLKIETVEDAIEYVEDILDAM